MMKLTSVVVLCAFVGCIKADYCQENFTLADFPGGIAQEIISIILTGTIGHFSGCQGTPPVVDEDVKFLLYNHANPEVPIQLDPKNPVEVVASKPTILFIHGWTCSVTGSRMPELKNAYLQRYDSNVIGIDWSSRSVALFSSAFCSTPGVAKLVAAFLCTLNTQHQVDPNQVHVVGHSMGGQIAGMTGQEIRKQCGKILGRATGLDPAGLLFQTSSEENRLDSSDAEFVDVIHSNQAILGYFGPCGDVDFFPNCGTYQPGCPKIDTLSVEEIMNLPLSAVICSHFRSCDFMIESINPGNKTFTATSCETCPGLPTMGPCVKDILFPKQTVMGEDCPSNLPASKFYLTTNSKSQYAQG